MADVDRQDMVDIGSRIREIRETKKMTATDLAKLADMTAATLSRIENGAASPNIKTLIKISEVLEVPFSALQPKRLDKYSTLLLTIMTPIIPYLNKFRQKSQKSQKEIIKLVASLFISLIDIH